MEESVVAVLGGYVFAAIAGNLFLVACTADHQRLRAKWDAWRHPIDEAEEDRLRNVRYAYTYGRFGLPVPPHVAKRAGLGGDR